MSCQTTYSTIIGRFRALSIILDARCNDFFCDQQGRRLSFLGAPKTFRDECLLLALFITLAFIAFLFCRDYHVEIIRLERATYSFVVFSLRRNDLCRYGILSAQISFGARSEHD
jgi:hypothetical protein